MPPGYAKPPYVLPFDHRASFETGMFGWKGALNAEQTAQIAAAKRVIYDSFVAAIAGGIRTWLATAAAVPGFIGFAVGRTTFWQPLVDWRAQKTTREDAVTEVARRYREWVDVFEQARGA